MSLINDMLQDLAQRQKQTRAGAPAQMNGAPLALGSKPLSTGWLWGGLVVLLLGALGWYGFDLFPLRVAHTPRTTVVNQASSYVPVMASSRFTSALPAVMAPPNPVAIKRPTVTSHAVARQRMHPAKRLTSKPLRPMKTFYRLSPNEVRQAQFQRALQAVAQGQWQQGEQQLKSLLRKSPEDQKVLSTLSALEIKLQQPASALLYIAKGLQQHPTDPAFTLLEGRALFQQKKYAAALVALERADVPMASMPHRYELMALILQQLGKPQSAADVYRNVTRVLPEDPRAWLGLAVNLQTLGHVNAARNAYQQVLRHNAHSPWLSSYARQQIRALEQGA